MKKTVIDELIETFEEMLAYGGDSDLHAAIEHCKAKKEINKQ